MIYSKLQFSKFVFSSDFGELQLTQISLNFKNSCNLKIRGLWVILCAAFLLFLFWKELWRFKIKEFVLFVEQKYKVLIKTRRNRKWKIPHTDLEGWTICFSPYKNCELNVKPWWVVARRKKKGCIFYSIFHNI